MSQCIRNKVESSLWKSCLKQPSLEILQNANLNVLLVITECISHGCCGKRIDFSIDIIRRAGYQSWDCHVGSHNHHFCTLSQSFEKLCFSLKRWGSFKVMIGPNLLHCTRFLLYGSGLHATYHGRSANSREAKGFISGLALIWQIIWNIWWRSFDPELSFDCLEWQVTSTFMELGRCSAVVVIAWCKRYLQIFMEILLSLTYLGSSLIIICFITF